MLACLLLDVLLAPSELEKITDQQWDLLIRQGRRANLLSHLAHRFVLAGALDDVPVAPRNHLKSALIVAAQQDLAMRWEVSCIRDALSADGIPLILLKGAAYLIAELPISAGRMFSDVDILVPKAILGKTEGRLMIHGWHSGIQDSYYQEYYRRWMHEIPPMKHIERGTYIDVHHSILPETARIKVNTGLFFEKLVPVGALAGVYVLQPEDMLLHSATHLFHEGELEKGLRDLIDLDALFRNFGECEGFWDRLLPRAQELGLLRPLFYASRFSMRILKTPIPISFVEKLATIAAPSSLILRIMDFCYSRALLPVHKSCDVSGTSLARLALYLRSHWIRMPVHLLAYHLTRKAFFSNRQKKEVASEVL